MEGKICPEVREELIKNIRGKKRGFAEGSETTTSRGAKLNSRSACKKKFTQKTPTLIHKLK